MAQAPDTTTDARLYAPQTPIEDASSGQTLRLVQPGERYRRLATGEKV